ncbi:Ras-associating and dilute domain-containing protein [Camelus dromedarius]|uniref:Ras-associating and dilute domain-containing protein n=1 Tax=Camelus dromedarius TaxID=9838 RepID=A0A5N4CWR5_CAMDR|nr:Ras-associating and dilute domain-containing protein [Camelus dromedarius]KAB1263275.1 Ras-associating and dilute domain-containing protein [Camelus dromedarius]KAB1263276.1 Ras-associating and dilute domain-containing protein [Camelus dromedarius]
MVGVVGTWLEGVPFSCTLTASEEAMAVRREVIRTPSSIVCTTSQDGVPGGAGARPPSCPMSCDRSCRCYQAALTAAAACMCNPEIAPRCWPTSSLLHPLLLTSFLTGVERCPAICPRPPVPTPTSPYPERGPKQAIALERTRFPTCPEAGSGGLDPLGQPLSELLPLAQEVSRPAPACSSSWTERGAGFGEAGEHFYFFRKLSCLPPPGWPLPSAQLIQVGVVQRVGPPSAAGGPGGGPGAGSVYPALLVSGINAQARRLQRSRAKGTPAPASGGTQSPPLPRLRRTVSETSLSSATTLLDAARGPEEPGQDTMRCSLYESPHLLLLQGYSQQHDSLVYVLNRERHTVGQRTPSSKPSINLAAPDILPLHCTIRRRQPSGGEQAGPRLVLEPIPGAPVSVNFSEVGGCAVALRHGDLLSLGLYYLLLFKDPAQAQPLPAQALARLRAVPQSCRMCGTVLRARGASASERAALPRPRPLHLEFEPDMEDTLLQRIMTLEKTKELAEKQAHLQEPLSSASFTMAGLAPDLQPILFWMSNSVELLYFIQQKCPLYMQSLEEELNVTGSKESLFSCTLTASEEAMAVLEEVILYAFQQCVYYVSKSLYVCLPALLECPPFQTECREGWCPAPQLPEELRRVVSVYQAALDLLRQLHVHPEIAAQVLAYLFFFSSTLLLNQLLDRGPSLSCFHWPRGVQACARLQQLLDWTRGAGFGEAGEHFFRKLSCSLNLLATPSAQLIQEFLLVTQMSWANLRAAFPSLSPAQLHRLLTQYQLASAMGPMSAWEPGAQDSPEAFKSEEVLESYENPPPIVLPSEGFQVDLEADCLDDSIYQHLLYIRHFLWSLRSKPSPGGGPAQPACPEGPCLTSPEGLPKAQSCPLASRDPGRGAREASPERPLPSAGAPRAQGPPRRQPSRASRGGAQARPLHGDSSCLLTPPSTPLGPEPSVPDQPAPSSACGEALLEGRRNGPSGPWGTAPEGECAALAAEPPPAPSSRSSSTDDFCCMFVVELERGPSGLGMGLIDGMHTPLGAPGLYIQTLLPGSPAAADGRLSLGDRILEVNGSSLVGVSYLRAVDLIRHGGKKMRFLVAKSDVETAKKIRFRTPPP